MKIAKTVITAAGMGTRLLPYTKETPKEMLPIFARSNIGDPILKPILQVIYESVFDYGLRNFCFVVGRGKRSIEDHFLISKLDEIKSNKKTELEILFKKIRKSNIIFVQQSSPRGFGDAVLKAKYFVGDSNFLLHAGDDIIISKKNDHLRRLENAFFENNADMAFLVTRTKDPRAYGVIEGKYTHDGIIKVENLEEKPKKPKSDLAVIATYLFKPSIFNMLEKTRPDKKGEIQLAWAVKKIIENKKTIAVELQKNELRIDVGTPPSYLKCINESYDIASIVKND